MKLEVALKKFFGHDEFRGEQRNIIKKIIAGDNILAVMPTGAGKSLCYQLPAVVTPGYTIVVSPLIALMKDQVDTLNKIGIPAAFLNSTQTHSQQMEVQRQILSLGIKMLYVAPERLRVDSFRAAIIAAPPHRLVIDEAHCISSFGHDFRPDYQRISQFIKEMNIVQTCAFTATATPEVREDIKKQLRRNNLSTISTGFQRPNLAMATQICANEAHKKKLLIDMLREPDTPTLIYCSTRKTVDSLSEELGIRGYHGGMSDKDRSDCQDYFLNDKCPIVIATNSLGLGIDRPDLRRVIHYNFPGTIEAYYQEAGRAGRDRLPAECQMLYSSYDRNTHEFLIKTSHPEEESVREVWEILSAIPPVDGRVFISVSELKDRLNDKTIESQISSILTILQKYKHIERGNSTDNMGYAQADGERFNNLRSLIGRKRCSRGNVAAALIYSCGEDLREGFKISYSRLAEICGIELAPLKRQLSALRKDGLNWQSPDLGRPIIVENPGEILRIDFHVLRNHYRQEIEKLEKTISYAVTDKCRQATIMRHFGQLATGFSCGKCDNCVENAR